MKDLSAAKARSLARKRLQAVALLGLPRKPPLKSKTEITTTFTELVEQFFQDRPFAWKPQTFTRHHNIVHSVLSPHYGEMRVSAIRREDIMRWRETRAERPGSFNIEVACLISLLDYAEKLGLRKTGTNPARGTPRFGQAEKSRFLAAVEYRRLYERLGGCEDVYMVAAIKLLIHTGARPGEVINLRWGEVAEERLELPDSKTGPKTIILSRQAKAILDSLPRREAHHLVFSRSGIKRLRLDVWWPKFRRTAGLPDVRLHDLRHSYASVAIQNGIDLAHIGKLLGHSLLETTQRYAHLTDQCIFDAAETVGTSIYELMGWTDVAA